MGLPYIELFFDEDAHETLVCVSCHLPLCYRYEIIRDDYQCQSGKAYFVAQV